MVAQDPPSEFVPFPWEDEFWEGGPEQLPCYERIAQLRQQWNRARPIPFEATPKTEPATGEPMPTNDAGALKATLSGK